MKIKTPTEKSQVVKRLATVAAVWAVAKMLDVPRVARAARKIDEGFERSANVTGKSMKRAGSNARHHTGFVIAGVAALAVAAGLLGRATMK